MKKIIFLSAALLLSVNVFSQTGNVGINTSTPNPNAVLDVVSTNKGLLPPRVALTATNSTAPLGSPLAGGMVVYNTATAGTSPNDVVPGLYVYDGTQWAGMVNISTLNALGIPRPSVFELSTSMSNFLIAQSTGGKQALTPVAQVANVSGSGITFNAATSVITFTPGLYTITVTYEGEHNNGACSLSSYLVDFPIGSSPSFQRVHNTASHSTGVLSNHGGSITFTTRITANYPWTIEIGRGQSGNCLGAGNTLFQKSTQLSILRIGS